MINDPKLLNRFCLCGDDLDKNAEIKKAYDHYSDKRYNFGQAAREFKEATKEFHEALDAPLRAQGLVPEGKDWTLKEDDQDGICIYVWSEPKRSGRQRRSEIPVKQLADVSEAASRKPGVTLRSLINGANVCDGGA